MSNEQSKDQSLVEFEIEEAKYKPDLELGDRYQKFSAEILRLALLGIAGVGFLISKIVLSPDGKGFQNHVHAVRCWLIAAVVCLAIAAGAALIHRYVATDSISDLIQFLRELKRKGRADADKSRRWFSRKLKVSAWLLIAATASLAAGAFCVAISFVSIFQ